MNIAQLHGLIFSGNGYTTDSRTVKPGQVFFALTGDNFNGNVFAQRAIEQGASCAVIDDADYQVEGKTWLVEDVLTTFQDLSRYHRRQFDIPVIAITGSNGKTTTKELIYAVLSKKYHTLATIGNLNNHIGVPGTLLRLRSEHDMAIIEMGANHQKEIAQLSSIAEPTHGVITSIGKAHLEGFGGPEGVKQGKAELYEWLTTHQGLTFLNIDLPVLCEMAEKKGCPKRVTYGIDPEATYSFQLLAADPFVKFSFQGQIVSTKLPGAYNFNNFITAFAIGLYFEVQVSDIVSALEAYQADNKRSQMVTWQGHTVVLDAYNANPTSMQVALDNFVSMEASTRVAVLGDMLELGDYSDLEHQALVDRVQDMPVDHVCLIGSCFAKVTVSDPRMVQVPNAAAARVWLDALDLKEKTVILLKGSNSIHVDSVIQ
jgi:UDP-N-acetylmuramoyl-tripeptide--D-alanyl-D-alanine ligase